MKSISIDYTRAVGNYNRSPAGRTPRHTMVTDDGTSSRSRALRSGKKGIVWMEDIIPRFCSMYKQFLTFMQVSLPQGRPVCCY